MVLIYQSLVCTELKYNLQYSSLIELTQPLCSHFPSMQKGRIEEDLSTRKLVGGSFAVHTKVSMRVLVVYLEYLMPSILSFVLLFVSSSCI